MVREKKRERERERDGERERRRRERSLKIDKFQNVQWNKGNETDKEGHGSSIDRGKRMQIVL